jgi:hypothetical protein
MSKRKTVIELQSKPENKSVRQIIQKTKPVEFAPISPLIPKLAPEESADVVEKKPQAQKSQNAKTKANSAESKSAQQVKAKTFKKESSPKREGEENSLTLGKAANPQAKRLRIFQASTPVTRTLTKFQKAAIVVRGENGKQLIELLWRDQMNEKTKDIWDYLCEKFVQVAEEQKTNEVTIRKRDILEGSGVKSDRTFISAIYTLEDMGLIEVKRLSGNKEGNIYVLTEEGREEIESYQNIRK